MKVFRTHTTDNHGIAMNLPRIVTLITGLSLKFDQPETPAGVFRVVELGNIKEVPFSVCNTLFTQDDMQMFNSPQFFERAIHRFSQAAGIDTKTKVFVQFFEGTGLEQQGSLSFIRDPVTRALDALKSLTGNAPRVVKPYEGPERRTAARH